MRPFLLAALLAIVTATPLMAQTKGSDLSGPVKPERGWFFFEDPPLPPVEEPVSTFKSQIPSTPPPPPKEERCKKKDTWSVDCGFVHPGEDFQFQAKQRDALVERMSVAKNDLKAVEAFQYYMRYVIDRTSEVTNNWWYNMVQNPDLDPNVSNPVSAFGIRLMTEVKQGKDKEVYDLIKAEGGYLVYFTRSDCIFCHQMATTVQRLATRTGLVVRNAALDDKCIPEFVTGCVTAPATLGPAQMLQVTTVPTVFLHVPPSTWLRIATGVVDMESTLTRTSQFFSAYRAALVSGVENGEKGRPSVDFSAAEVSGASAGVDRKAAAPALVPPSPAELSRMLGGPPP